MVVTVPQPRFKPSPPLPTHSFDVKSLLFKEGTLSWLLPQDCVCRDLTGLQGILETLTAFLHGNCLADSTKQSHRVNANYVRVHHNIIQVQPCKYPLSYSVKGRVLSSGIKKIRFEPGLHVLCDAQRTGTQRLVPS